MWSHIDAELRTRGPWLAGPGCTAVDIYLTMLTRWSRNLAKPATGHPHIAQLVERVKARPAYRTMMQVEGID